MERADAMPIAVLNQATQDLSASFQHLREALLARAAALAAMSQVVNEARESVERPPQLKGVGAHIPAPAGEQLCGLLSEWLRDGNEGRSLSAAQLHRECAALAAQRGWGAEWLGDARSFGLRLSRHARRWSDRLRLVRHAGPGRHTEWSLHAAQ